LELDPAGKILAQRIADARAFAEQMQKAMQSRGVVDEALGGMGQRGCTADEVFGIRRSASRHRNIKLATCAPN
jgi:hypothetical protein